MINKNMIHMAHTFMKIDHEIISMVILLLPLVQEGLLSLTIEILHKELVKLNNSLVKLAQVKSVVR